MSLACLISLASKLIAAISLTITAPPRSQLVSARIANRDAIAQQLFQERRFTCAEETRENGLGNRRSSSACFWWHSELLQKRALTLYVLGEGYY